jgi:hypothetical protein
MDKVSDDLKPMFGVWYRNTEHPWMLGKVTGVGLDYVEVTATDGIDTCTHEEFAQVWELI